MWSAVKDLLHTNHDRGDGSRSTEDVTAFCSKWATFFIEKVTNIKSGILPALAGLNYDSLASDLEYRGPCLSQFAPVSEIEDERLISSMSSKSSPLDFVSTTMIKACHGKFAIIITRLANLSFDHATFPTRFKTAQITPLLKKNGLDNYDPINYRPISNLNTVSKILERLVLARSFHTSQHQLTSIRCSWPTVNTTQRRPRCSRLQTTSMKGSTIDSLQFLSPLTNQQRLIASIIRR